MNHRLADNSVASMHQYLLSQLTTRYEARESANICAELFAEFKQWNRAEVALSKSQRLSESEILVFHFALKRLLQGEPLQYITGKAWFHGLLFYVNPDVLIPRPETEELVEWIIQEAAPNSKIMDIGTGSGCIAIALQKKLNTSVDALDISASALEMAKKNATVHQADIRFIHQDILAPFEIDVKYDIVVSNPPYIPWAEKDSLRNQVTDFEPHQALFVPDDNALIYYQRILEWAKNHLKPNGKIFFEIHENLSESMRHLLQSYPTNHIEFRKDMQGKERMVRCILNPHQT